MELDGRTSTQCASMTSLVSWFGYSLLVSPASSALSELSILLSRPCTPADAAVLVTEALGVLARGEAEHMRAATLTATPRDTIRINGTLRGVFRNSIGTDVTTCPRCPNVADDPSQLEADPEILDRFSLIFSLRDEPFSFYGSPLILSIPGDRKPAELPRSTRSRSRTHGEGDACCPGRGSSARVAPGHAPAGCAARGTRR